MSQRIHSLAIGSFYHIYNRGNSKQIIYKDVQDYQRFVGLLYSCNSMSAVKYNNLPGNSDLLSTIKDSEPIVAIGAYCLMPNHFHILLTPLVENGVSIFMQKISTAYVMYFNKKYSRSGGLFEGKFRSSLAQDDIYLKYLFSYIHLNPIKMIDPLWKEAGIQNKNQALLYLNSYSYSSYADFSGIKRRENKILNISVFPNYFPHVKSFEKEILSWFSSRQDLDI